LLVLDIDPRHGGPASLAQLEVQYGPLPKTVTAATGGGGCHYYFRYPLDGMYRNTAGKLGPGIDTRGAGGYVLAPPSNHASGNLYRWIHDPESTPLADAPGWLLDLLREPARKPRGAAGPDPLNGQGIPEGKRNATLMSMAGVMRRAGVEREEIATALHIVNRKRCDVPLDEAEVERIAASVARYDPADDAPDPAAEWQPFPVELLPDTMRDFALSAAAATDTDPAWAALGALVTATACIGNRARIEVFPGWSEAAVLWGTIVGRSGTTKTPLLRLITRPLIELFKAERVEHERAMREHVSALARYEVDLATWKKSQRDGPATDPPLEPERPIEKRVLVADITVERLATMLNDNPLGLLCVRDELSGLIGGFDRYAAGGRGNDREAYLSMYSAEHVLVDRKTGGVSIFVEHAAVSLLGGIQPRTLKRTFARAERESGFLARFLLVWPPQRPSRWSAGVLDPAAVFAWRDLLAALLDWRPATDDSGSPIPATVGVGSDARRVFIAWRDLLGKDIDATDDDDLRAALDKLRGIALRLALTLATCEASAAGGAVVVTPGVMERACKLASWFGSEAARLYPLLASDEGGVDPATADRRKLVAWIRQHGNRCTARDLARGPRRFRDQPELAREALDALVKAGFGRWDYTQPGPAGGRATATFRLGDIGDGDETPRHDPENRGSGTVASVASVESVGDGPPDEVVWRVPEADPDAEPIYDDPADCS